MAINAINICIISNMYVEQICPVIHLPVVPMPPWPLFWAVLTYSQQLYRHLLVRRRDAGRYSIFSIAAKTPKSNFEHGLMKVGVGVCRFLWCRGCPQGFHQAFFLKQAPEVSVGCKHMSWHFCSGDGWNGGDGNGSQGFTEWVHLLHQQKRKQWATIHAHFGSNIPTA